MKIFSMRNLSLILLATLLSGGWYWTSSGPGYPRDDNFGPEQLHQMRRDINLEWVSNEPQFVGGEGFQKSLHDQAIKSLSEGKVGKDYLFIGQVWVGDHQHGTLWVEASPSLQERGLTEELLNSPKGPLLSVVPNRQTSQAGRDVHQVALNILKLLGPDRVARGYRLFWWAVSSITLGLIFIGAAKRLNPPKKEDEPD